MGPVELYSGTSGTPRGVANVDGWRRSVGDRPAVAVVAPTFQRAAARCPLRQTSHGHPVVRTIPVIPEHGSKKHAQCKNCRDKLIHIIMPAIMPYTHTDIYTYIYIYMHTHILTYS